MLLEHVSLHIVIRNHFSTLGCVPPLFCYCFYVQCLQCTDLLTVFVLKVQSAWTSPYSDMYPRYNSCTTHNLLSVVSFSKWVFHIFSLSTCFSFHSVSSRVKGKNAAYMEHCVNEWELVSVCVPFSLWHCLSLKHNRAFSSSRHLRHPTYYS